jgi:tRNA dimethylallyltransferase
VSHADRRRALPTRSLRIEHKADGLTRTKGKRPTKDGRNEGRIWGCRTAKRVRAGCRKSSPLDEIRARKTLRIKERREISVLDARVRRSRDLGLGAIGDAEAGRLQHRKIVGAVADSQRVAKREPHRGGDLFQRGKLGVLAEDRLDDLARQLAAFDDERIGAVLVGAKALPDCARELAKAARDDGDIGAVRSHCLNERARAGIERDALLEHLADDRLGKPGEQRDALAQRRRERHFSTHRSLGDRRDANAYSHDIRKFIYAFLADQRRIHIRDQKALPAMSKRLDDDVDGLLRERALERGAPGLEVAGENKIGRNALVEPAPALDPIEGLRGPVDCCFAERRVQWVGNERGDEDGRHDASRRAGNPLRRALLIAGPTASGKSAAALALATRFGATIVNADSMQVYRDLRILTARPTPDEEQFAPHRMFGAIDGAINFSVGRWALAAGEVLAEIGERPVIFVGGTGLYFRALTEGLSDIPPVPDAVRAEVRAKAEGRATPELHDELRARDPETAVRLNASDRQRILRALEVVAATGRPLVSFLSARAAPTLKPGEWAGLYLAPDRAELGQRIDARFEAMIARGALDEVAALKRRRLDPALPVMRAHGVPHLIAHLEGRMKRDEAAKRSKLDTRHYAKRQFTWARHQLSGFTWVAPEEAVEAGTKAFE